MNRVSRPRLLFVMGSVAALLALGAAPALACGGLVGENGTIELVRTTTLAAYSDGVERYVTAFEFTGEGEGSGLDHPAPRRAHQGGAGRRLDAATACPRGRTRGALRPSKHSLQPLPGRRGHPRGRDRCSRYHRAAGWG